MVPHRFSPEIEAIIQAVDTERRAREALERLEAHLDTIEAAKLSDDDVAQCLVWLRRQIAQEQ